MIHRSLVGFSVVCLSLSVLQAQTTVNATFNINGGFKDGHAAIKGVAKVTCTHTSSDQWNPNVPAVCEIYAPGIPGIKLRRGEVAGTSGPGTLTMRCSGAGYILACTCKIE